MLLEATMAELATCTLTHITELQAGRNLVATLIDQTSTPQALVRVGFASQVEDQPPPTPRQPLGDSTSGRTTINNHYSQKPT